MTPDTAAQSVARKADGTIAVGFVDFATASRPIAVVGMSWIDAVLIARKVHIALEATPGRGLSFSSRLIARRPSGVAALPRPSMFAAMFMSIAPIAGCSAGTSGKRRTISGRSARARICTKPDRSASRMIPSQIAITPMSGSAIFITAIFAVSKAPVVICGSLPVKPPTSTAIRRKASQM